MQNWESSAVNYEQNWYGNFFPISTIKTEPQSTISTLQSLIEHHQTFLKPIENRAEMNSLTPSPRNSEQSNEGPSNFYENTTNSTAMLLSQSQNPLGFNPLTPPGLPNAILPQMNFQSGQLHQQQNEIHQIELKRQNSQPHQSQQEKIDHQSLTPRNTPPMDITPPKSPKSYNDYQDQDIQSNSNGESDNDDNHSEVRLPNFNSHGKVKNYKCKNCGLISLTKLEFWEHTREHMKPEKILQCRKCPFVTELKHHLEYHLRKHDKLKPFQCIKCNYTCENKSMLNSHAKSHSSVYQYRCSDCDYATKYCHSFKLHLRKYDHKPGLVLDDEGLPNPSIIIDVYGTRRGPKMKSTSYHGSRRSSSKANNQSRNESNNKTVKTTLSPIKSSQQPQQPNNIPNFLPTPLANMLQQSHNMSSFFPYWNLNLQMLAAQQQAVLAQLSPSLRENSFKKNTIKSTEDNLDDIDSKSNQSAMDLSSPQGTPIKFNQNQNQHQQQPQQQHQHQQQQILNDTTDDINTPTVSSTSASRRKGRVLKLENREISTSSSSNISSRLNQNIENSEDDEDDKDSDIELSPIIGTTKELDLIDTKDNISLELKDESNMHQQINSSNNNNNGNANSSNLTGIFECKYCDIYFKDAVLYTIHMGYHSCDDVFKCNMCGEKCEGAVGLFVHMARNAHS